MNGRDIIGRDVFFGGRTYTIDRLTSWSNDYAVIRRVKRSYRGRPPQVVELFAPVSKLRAALAEKDAHR
jgi:hypothetical protein